MDDVYKTISATDDAEKQAEGKKIIEQLGALKYEMLHDRQMTYASTPLTFDKQKIQILTNIPYRPLVEDGFSDETAAYNKELEQLGNPTWFQVPWLFAECYMYRYVADSQEQLLPSSIMLTYLLHSRLNTFFTTTQHWKSYDLFARQKIDSFRTSRNAVAELAARYEDIVTKIRADKNITHDSEAEKILFMEMCEVCLWGNATDLSLLTTMTYEDIQRLQGSEARKAAEKNILVNKLPQAYDLLNKARAEGKKERRVDFVLDNSGFELYVDLVLAGYLLNTGLATHVVLRPKSIPWFVSDVLPADFAALLSALANPKKFFEAPTEEERVAEKTPAPLSEKEAQSLSFVFQDWATQHGEGQLAIRPNRYWTAGGSFWRLPHEAPELYEDLKQAELVIFKGDLNYRKLTADVSDLHYESIHKVHN